MRGGCLRGCFQHSNLYTLKNGGWGGWGLDFKMLPHRPGCRYPRIVMKGISPAVRLEEGCLKYQVGAFSLPCKPPKPNPKLPKPKIPSNPKPLNPKLPQPQTALNSLRASTPTAPPPKSRCGRCPLCLGRAGTVEAFTWGLGFRV